MVWQQWLYAAYAAINVLALISMIGRERKPLTPGVAAFSVGAYALIVWLVLSI